MENGHGEYARATKRAKGDHVTVGNGDEVSAPATKRANVARYSYTMENGAEGFAPTCTEKVASKVLQRSASMAKNLFDPEFHSAMEQCKGIRVVYFDDERVHETMCDHEEKHNEKWRKELTPRRVETGTIAGHLLSSDGSLSDAVLIVRWDCGEEKLYSFIHGEWEKLRTLHLAAAGYLGSMVYCDVCQLPMLGFAFRCGSDQCSPQTEGGVLFDLCLHHYNGDEHFPDHPFRCFLPSGDITSTGLKLPPRRDPDRYQLLGMYPGAIVTGLTEPTQLKEGRVLRIVHDGGQDKICKAKEYWYCTYELDTEPYSKEKQHPLQYQDAGKAGQCQLKVTEPALGGPVYPSHFPTIDFTLLKAMALYHKGLCRMDDGNMCFIRTKGPADICWSISITGTKLTFIKDSEKVWSLCHGRLEILNLTHNMLETLPERLVDFRETLKLLCVSFNCFSRIPEVVFELISLLHLNMFDNQITKVPEDIGRLSCLTSLFLGKNKIHSLPDVFGSLHALLVAGFKDNHLSELPDSFKRLQKLQRVELGYNRFTKIPDELFHLNQLESLHIEHNRIQRISHPHIEILSRLTSLSLAGNPLQHPAFLLCPDSEVISLLWTHFNPSSRVSCRFRPSLRILVLGKGGSGKTSVVKAFCSCEHVTPVEDLEYDHTVGINQYRIPFNMGGEVQELVLWDFAGEEEAAVINEIFQSERTLIWLVVNLKAYERGSDESYSEHVGDWLDSLLTRISKPVVWVVATHTDELQADEVDKKCFNIRYRITDDCKEAAKSIDEKVEKIEQQLKSSTLDLPSRTSLENDLKPYHSLQAAGPKYLLENVKVLPLTNTHSFKGFDTLREHLETLPADSAFQHLNDPLSEKWVNATNAIRKYSNILLSSSKPPIVSLRVVHESLWLIIPESTERDSLLEYLHQNGEIHVLFSDSATDGATVVLDVPWLIDILKHIFRHDFEKSVSKKYENYPCFRKRLHRDALKKALKENRTNGVVKVSLLKALWRVEDVKEDAFKVIIGLLTKFGLAYESRKMDGYLFPWLLSAKACPDIPEHELFQGSNHVSIRYSFAPHCKPKGLFARFIVLCRERVVPTFDNVSRCSFEATLGNTCLRAVHTCGKIEVHIYSVRGSAVGPTSYGKLWQILMQLVKELEVLLQEWKGQQIDRYVLCPNCFEVPESDPELFQLEYMWPGPEYLEYHSQRCLSCATRTSARSCEIALEKIVPPKEFMVNAPDEVAELPIETQHPVSNTPQSVPTMTELTVLHINGRERVKVIERISTNYHDFGILLLEDDTGVRLKAIVHECRENPKDINREILVQWLAGKGKEPVSWKTLIEVLKDIDLKALASDIESALQ